VAPGFDFADFELGETGALIAAFPDAAALIRRLGR
jgi:predicted cupin superfamily sugar epimerase